MKNQPVAFLSTQWFKDNFCQTDFINSDTYAGRRDAGRTERGDG